MIEYMKINTDKAEWTGQGRIGCSDKKETSSMLLYLRAFSPTAETSTPSIAITPPSSSVSRRRPESDKQSKQKEWEKLKEWKECEIFEMASKVLYCISPLNRLLFPDPVLPTMPTLDPGAIWRLTPFSTGSKSSLYLILTWVGSQD
jgi:hypothetical protein